MAGALEGIKVVEMGVWVAGPSRAAILCDWGADVVKIEPPTGDPFRGLFASALGAAVPINPPFEIDNRGKRSICLEPGERRRPRRSRAGCSTRRTSSSRTCGRACSSSSASPTTRSARRTRASSTAQLTG